MAKEDKTREKIIVSEWIFGGDRLTNEIEYLHYLSNDPLGLKKSIDEYKDQINTLERIYKREANYIAFS